jgi:CoA-transferase family III
MALSRRGAASPGGSCRLLPACDGFIAINLARPEDYATIPAWLESASVDWVAEARQHSTRDLLARGRLLGLAVAVLDEPPPEWHTEQSVGIRALPRARPPVVLDFSSLWAGPLAGALLASAGAQVLKVESTVRPDGARAGNEAFFDRLNGGKSAVVIDFGSAEGRAALRRLIAYGQAIFAGDAIADPLTGLHAACAAWAAWLRGGGSVVGLSLAGVVTRGLALAAGWPAQLADWSRLAARDTAPLYALPEPVWAARALGADTRAALAA